eukprot:5912345-Amphidinium_carterae.1
MKQVINPQKGGDGLKRMPVGKSSLILRRGRVSTEAVTRKEVSPVVALPLPVSLVCGRRFVTVSFGFPDYPRPMLQRRGQTTPQVLVSTAILTHVVVLS